MFDYHSFPARPHYYGPRYGIFSGAVHIDRPYGARNIHTRGSVVGVRVVILVLNVLAAMTRCGPTLDKEACRNGCGPVVQR